MTRHGCRCQYRVSFIFIHIFKPTFVDLCLPYCKSAKESWISRISRSLNEFSILFKKVN